MPNSAPNPASARWTHPAAILVATGRSAFENLTRDRTIYRVLAHARCPVLTLREPTANPAAPEAESMATRL
jgi:hypothetical protein